MPRTARQKSNSGIYHVILHGVNRQRIFDVPCVIIDMNTAPSFLGTEPRIFGGFFVEIGVIMRQLQGQMRGLLPYTFRTLLLVSIFIFIYLLCFLIVAQV